MEKIYTSYDVARILDNILDYSDGNMADLKDNLDSIEQTYFHNLSEKSKQSIKNIDEFLNNYNYIESEE